MKKIENLEVLDKMCEYYKKQMRAQFWGFVSLYVVIIIGICVLIF